MSIHDDTAAAIEAGHPGYAQMTRDDHGHDIVSWHDNTFTETIPSGWNTAEEARAAFIDAWAVGKARVTKGTFSDHQILERADQWKHGRGPHIRRGFKDPEFAETVLVLIPAAADMKQSAA
jgi:hypothetical protein